MVYCRECGSEIKDLSQNFCEKCGSPIPDSVKQSGTATAPVTAPTRPSGEKAYQAPGSLFDINRNYYILKEKYWDWGSGDILDENNQIIGKLGKIK